MKKVLLAVLLSGFALSASAATSPTCEKYFADLDDFVKMAPADQQAALKQQNEETKKKI